MRAYTIKHKGAMIWQNMSIDHSIEYSDNDKCYVSNLFFRKKDAQRYLESFKYKEFYEVIGVTFDKINSDNRKKH